MFAAFTGTRLHFDFTKEHTHVRIRRWSNSHAEFRTQVDDLCRRRRQLKITALDLARKPTGVEHSAGRTRWSEARGSLQNNASTRIELELGESGEQVNLFA